MCCHYLLAPGFELAPAIVVALYGSELRKRGVVLVHHHLEKDVSLLVLVEDQKQRGGHGDVVVLEPVFGIFCLGGDGAPVVYVDKGREGLQDVVVAKAEMGGLVGICDGGIGLGENIFQKGNDAVAGGDVRVEGEVVVALPEFQALLRGEEVVKERTEYRLEEITAALDRVEGLGDFLELEIIVPESAVLADSGKETAFRRLEALLGELEYQMSGTGTRSYLSMLQKH